jgi:hypothetical protein
MSSMLRLLVSVVVLGLLGCAPKERTGTSAPEPASKPAEAPRQEPTSVPALDPAAESEGVAKISGPTAIGFFPPTSQKEKDEDDGGLSEGYAHLAFALEDLKKCLAPRKISLELKITRSLQVQDGTTSHKYDFPSDWQQAVGIVLAKPGQKPEVIYATGGPSSLQETAPQAAWKYFLEPNCKRYEE